MHAEQRGLGETTEPFEKASTTRYCNLLCQPLSLYCSSYSKKPAVKSADANIGLHETMVNQTHHKLQTIFSRHLLQMTAT